MTKQELFGRQLAKRLAVAAWKLERGVITDADFAKMGAVMDDFERPPLYIDDDTDTSLSNIRSEARCHQMRHGLDLLVIDYLTLIAVTDRLALWQDPEWRRIHVCQIRRNVERGRVTKQRVGRRAKVGISVDS